jgi:ABC-type Fe3+/spermidine/putrescine transport system ATPase subunit
LRLDRVSAGYGARRALHDVSVEVAAGRFAALLGPSGCGKTTALKVIAGLLHPEQGGVWFGIEPMTGVPPERRDVAMVFQKPLLFPHMSVAENVGFGLVVRGWPPDRRRAAIADALRLVQLDDYGSRRPRELSGGQEQRVALARALVIQPRMLLLDEPLSALDENLRADMRALIRRLQRQLGITTIFVTHDQREAAALADQIILLLDGRMAQSDPPRAFYTAPASDAVARFFGWCVVPGRCEQGRFEVEGGAFEVPAGVRDARTVAFHPSAARLSPAPPGVDALPGSIRVTVEHVSDLGAELRASVRLASGMRIDVVQPANGDHAALAADGANARLAVPPEALRFSSAPHDAS